MEPAFAETTGISSRGKIGATFLKCKGGNGMTNSRSRTHPARTATATGVGPLGHLTAAALRRMVPPQIHERGVQYANDGAIVDIAWRGTVLHAAVQGSDDEPYLVDVRRITRGRAAGTLVARCTCPYMEEWDDGWCKHIIAVLLVAMRDPAAIPNQPTVAGLLASLDRTALVRLVDWLVARDPILYDDLAAHLRRVRGKPPVMQ